MLSTFSPKFLVITFNLCSTVLVCFFWSLLLHVVVPYWQICSLCSTVLFSRSDHYPLFLVLNALLEGQTHLAPLYLVGSHGFLEQLQHAGASDGTGGGSVRVRSLTDEHGQAEERGPQNLVIPGAVRAQRRRDPVLSTRLQHALSDALVHCVLSLQPPQTF